MHTFNCYPVDTSHPCAKLIGQCNTIVASNSSHKDPHTTRGWSEGTAILKGARYTRMSIGLSNAAVAPITHACLFLETQQPPQYLDMVDNVKSMDAPPVSPIHGPLAALTLEPMMFNSAQEWSYGSLTSLTTD